MKLNQLLSANLRAMALGLSGIFAVANGLTAFGYDFSVGENDAKIYYNINPDGKTATVTYGSEKYNGKSLTIPETVTNDGKSYTITAIGTQAFQNSKVEALILPNTITEIQASAFRTSSIKNINYPKNLKYIRSYAFEGASVLNGILPEGLLTIEKGAFKESRIDSLYLPKTLTTIGENAFFKCAGIYKVRIPGSVKVVSYGAFGGCLKLSKVVIEEGVEKLESSAFQSYLLGGGGYQGAIDEVSFPSTLTTIGTSCFQHHKIKDVVLPNNIKEVGSYCFASSAVMESISFSSGMKVIPESVCRDCSKLIKVTIPNSIKEVEHDAFQSTPLLSHITFPESVETVGADVFLGSGLVDFTFPKNLAYVGQSMFENCDNLTEIVIPSTIKEIKKKAFSGCNHLRKISLPESLESLGESTFSDCTSLEEINIPANIKVLNGGTFYNCKSLKKIIVPEGITELKGSTFRACTSLSELQLPKSLTRIDGSFISDCKSLKELTIYHQLAGIGQITFHDCSLEALHFHRAVLPMWVTYTTSPTTIIDTDNNCTLYVPKGSSETYKASHEWAAFKNIVEEEYAEALNYQLSFPYSLTGGQILVNGEVAKGGVKEFEMGSDIVISTTAKDGYHLRALLVNGKDVTAEMENGSYTIRNIDANYTVDAEFAENPFTLSLCMANGGSLDVDVEKRGTFTCVIVPEEGWKINTVTFNGSDVTSELTEDNRYTTPAITRNSVLRVTFEDMNSAIGSIDYDATSVKVTVDNGGEVRIEGVEAGNPVRAYSVDGRLAGQVTSNGDVDVITLSQHGIYLIQTPGKTFKIQY